MGSVGDGSRTKRSPSPRRILRFVASWLGAMARSGCCARHGPTPANLWEVYDEDGNLEGSVRIDDPSSGDAGFRPRVFQASRTELWVQTRSELDVPYVVRYQVLGRCGGGFDEGLE